MSTTSCKSCLLILPPKSAGSTLTVPTVWPCALTTFKLNAAGLSFSVATGSPSDKKTNPGRLPQQSYLGFASCFLARAAGEHANLDVDSGGQAQALVERLDRFAG